MFAPGPSTEGGEDALIEGVLVRDGDCLFVGDAEPGSRFAVLWPFGTSWDDAAQAVVTSSGDAIPVGSIVSAGGGYPYAENVQQMSVTDELSERVGQCAEGEFRELAHVQHSITVKDATDAETDGDPTAWSEGWVRAPEPPIEARSSAVIADLDDTIVVTGGWEYLCPPGADCAVDPKLGAMFEREAGSWTMLAPAPGAGYQVWPGDDGFYLNPHFGPSAQGGLYNPNLGTWSGFPEPPESDSWRNDVAGVLRAQDATYEYAFGWVRDTTTDQWIEIPERPSPTREGESLTNSGRRLVVYGGQDWTVDEGRLLNDVWVWTPPMADS